MQMMTSSWADGRMDDLKHQVDDLGRRMDQGFSGLREELREHRRDMDGRFDKVDERFNRTQEMVIGLHATITRLSVTLLAVVAGLVVTRLA